MPTRVLLVDDEDHILTVLSDSLESAGFDVECASSGQEGLTYLKDHPVDLLIVDLKMPGMNGLEFAAQAPEWAPDGQIIILTGFGDMKTAIEAMRSGVYDYLTKPVDLDRLLQTLRKADERRRLIIENRDLLRRLTEANRIKAEFINGMSHEVRTPLGHITGFAQILQDTVEGLTNKQLRYIENIQTGATRLLDLFENILSFSTLKSGDVEVRPDPGNIRGMLQTAIDTARPEAADSGISLEIDGPCDEDVRVDRVICARVLGLLIDNAIKFNKESGSVRLGGRILEELPESVDVSDTTASTWLAVTVSDTGIGIPEDQHEHIFGLFTQADASLSRPYEGAGIGLALARSLAKLHGGNIIVESTLDVGSTFTLFLPISEEPL